ncbi:MAG: cupin domain-containing protein [Anaerolineae bacterium]|nr:cupin domain-containing protein [Anaerolineae bacterium]
MSEMINAYLYQPGEGELRWMGETFTYFLATDTRTGGAFALVEEQAIGGEIIPLHKHDDGESFYVLAGEISFYLDGQAGRRAGAGAFVHIPGGTIHGFRIESVMARYLILTTPRHGEFYRAITSPLPHAVIDDTVIGQACQAYGIEFVGPLPI